MLNKTKAGWQTCPCEYSKQQTQSIKSHGLKPESKNGLWKARASISALGYSSEVSALAVKLFSACVLFLLRRNCLLVSINDSRRKCIGLSAGSVSSGCWFFRSSAMRHPLGSMPRCCSSLRIIRLIHAASDSSPSNCWACSINSRSSGSSLNWNGGLPRLSFLCVDTSITPNVLCLCVITHYIHEKQKATPCSARNTYRASNHHR